MPNAPLELLAWKFSPTTTNIRSSFLLFQPWFSALEDARIPLPDSDARERFTTLTWPMRLGKTMAATQTRLAED